MKTLKLIARKLCRPALLAILGLGAFCSTSEASRIDFMVYAKGRWALIVPGSSAGGNVVWSSSRNCYITAHAARGEPLCVFFAATFAGEYTRDSGGYYTCLSRNYGAIPLPYVHETRVSTNPDCDFLHYWIRTNCDYTNRLVPIGARL